MTNKITELNIEPLLQEYLEHLYNECPDSFIIVKDGIEMTATDWCRRLGGTPKGKSNFEVLSAQFEKGNEIRSHDNDDDRGYDD